MHLPASIVLIFQYAAPRCAIAAAILTMSSAVRADLVHRYSFTSDASDSVGGAHAVVVDPGQPTAVFAFGQLDLSANIGQGSNNITEDAYVDLPNGIVSAAASSGTSGALTLEWWATASQVRVWSRLGDFGTSDGGEDSSIGGQDSDYIIVTPHSGRVGGNSLEATNHPSGGPEPAVQDFVPFGVGVQRHVAVVFDHNDPTEGPNGTMSLYRDGQFIDRNDIDPDIDLRTFVDNNNWLGRSQWPNDPTFVGSFDEFRIYDEAVTPELIQSNFIVGPDVLDPNDVASLTLEVDVNNGHTRIVNASNEAINFDYYKISSAAGALNAAAWNSLNRQNFDAIDGSDVGNVAGDSSGEGWDVSGGVGSNKLIELMLRDASSSLNAGEAISLGGAFDPSAFGVGNSGDLEFHFGLPGNELTAGDVVYVAAGLQGDLDFNERVDGSDLLRWQRGFGSAYDGADLEAIEAHLGDQASSIFAAPEPSTTWLTAFVTTVLSAHRILIVRTGFSAMRRRRCADVSSDTSGES